MNICLILITIFVLHKKIIELIILFIVFVTSIVIILVKSDIKLCNYFISNFFKYVF